MRSKSRGSSFENEVCSLLSFWISGGKRDDLFMRSQSSGARFTQRRKSGKDTAYQGGDITFADPLGEPLIKEWNIEVKTGYGSYRKIKSNGEVIKIPVIASRGTCRGEIIRYRDKIDALRWDVLDFLDSRQKKPVLMRMWDQCTRDAELTGRVPVLIFRRNGRSPCIMINATYGEELKSWFGEHQRMSILLNFTDICSIMLLKDFFGWIPNISIALKKRGNDD